MLVYVNQLEFEGDDALTMVFRTIARWLEEQTQHRFTITELISGREFLFDGKRVGTYQADARDPKIYGILFSKPDASVRGRQWITEIGIRFELGFVMVTVLLETSDISTRVTEIPVTTKPKLIQYLRDNCDLINSTVGLDIQTLSTDEETLRAFLYEIERDTRKTPLVLVSHKFDGGTVVSPRTLQGHLLGLAQVVVVGENMDSWLMARVLGKRYSSWGGAINVIYPSFRSASCHNRLYLPDELDDLQKAETNINLDVLSRITHFSNGYRKRQHFSPQDVRAKRAADYRKELQERYAKAETQETQFALLEEAFQQIEEHDAILEELKKQHEKELEAEQLDHLATRDLSDDKDRELWRLQSKIKALQSGVDRVTPAPLSIDALDAIAFPTPEKCLQVLADNYGDRIVVLDTAWKSCQESESFKHSQKLADLLGKLATAYFDMISSGPDSEARKVFSPNEFSARESETVVNNDEMRKRRTFDYMDEPVEMLRHLKIGVADSVLDTIRVHFHWDNTRQKIVIGYCGPHLPIASH